MASRTAERFCHLSASAADRLAERRTNLWLRIPAPGAAIREGREGRAIVLNYRKDRTTYWCEVHLSPVLDRRGRVLQYVGVQNDVTDRVEAERELRVQHDRAQDLARHDALTGLSNRGAFNTDADTLLSDLTGGESAAVLFIDLDRFKRVNDILGHDIGDEVLCAAADEFRRVLGPDALLARHAGDEFLAVFPAPNSAAAEARAAIAATRSTAPLLEHRIAGAITASVGWAVAQADHPRPLAELISEADAMMYRRKRIGNGHAGETRPSRLRSA